LITRKILEQNGFEIYEADNGIQGILMAQEIHPDLILMDINIPILDGYETATRIKGMPELKDIPIVALTGQCAEGDRERSLIAGCDGYMVKPINFETLPRKIVEYLNGAKDRVQDTVETGFLREYSQRLVHRLEAKIGELAETNRQLRESGQLMQNVYVDIMASLMNAMEKKDPYTVGHSERVTQFAQHIARRMGLSSEDISTLTRAGGLHDVGKLTIDLSSIKKKGNLSEEEWRKMREHPTIGAHILAPLTFLRKEIPIVSRHHERWDGTGYPDGLAGPELDLLTCIITAADSYDAMTSARSYREGIAGPHEVMDEILRCRGAQFHPDVADTLFKLVEERTIL
jgi:putative nucleotidyltransferase with HDIG domain